jgi:hypothetical protein
VSDIKLFQLEPGGVTELTGGSLAVEKTLQQLMERNLDSFLGVRFLASEYSTLRYRRSGTEALVAQ